MNTSSYRWFDFFFFRKSWKFIFLLIACLITSSYAGFKTPKLISDLSKYYSDDKKFQMSLIMLLLNFTWVYINRVIYQLTVNSYVRRLIQRARTMTYSCALKLKDFEGDKYPQGDIISRVLSDTEAVRDLITSGAFGVFIDLSYVLFCLFGLIKLHWQFGMGMGAVEILTAIGLFWGSGLMRKAFLNLRNTQGQVNRVSANLVGGLGELYYTPHEHFASQKSQVVFNRFLKIQNEVNVLDAVYCAIAESLYPLFLLVGIFLLPIFKIYEAALIFASVDLIQRSINPIKEVSGKMANIQRASAGISRTLHFLNSESYTPIERDKTIYDKNFPKNFSVNIDIESFHYQKRQNFVLKDIHIKIAKGESLGIIGTSGSGKSTLLNLIAGHLNLQAGEIFFSDAEDIFERPVKCSDMSYISQESHLFSEDLFFNLSFQTSLNATEKSSFQSFWDYASVEIPYLQELVANPNDKLNPSLLSLGQKELLVAMRALYLKRPVVLLDEISQGLDSKLELALRKCFMLLKENGILIVVAHRLETIIGLDKILLLREGRMEAYGNHQELLKSSIYYQELLRELS